MTRKHYKMIAAAIKNNTNKHGVLDQTGLVARLCDAFAADNKNFNREKFIEAAGCKLNF